MQENTSGLSWPATWVEVVEVEVVSAVPCQCQQPSQVSRNTPAVWWDSPSAWGQDNCSWRMRPCVIEMRCAFTTWECPLLRWSPLPSPGPPPQEPILSPCSPRSNAPLPSPSVEKAGQSLIIGGSHRFITSQVVKTSKSLFWRESVVIGPYVTLKSV